MLSTSTVQHNWSEPSRPQPIRPGAFVFPEVTVAKRVCTEPGCPAVIDAGTRGGRCATHRRSREAERGTRQERGYDAAHVRLRVSYQRRMNDGERFVCWRGGEPIDPGYWTLGHCDDDRTRYHGPECPPCDYATAGRTGCPHPSHN